MLFPVPKQPHGEDRQGLDEAKFSRTNPSVKFLAGGNTLFAHAREVKDNHEGASQRILVPNDFVRESSKL